MNKSIVAYEVLRIIDSKPLFADDHYSRLLNSVQSIDESLQISKHGFFKQLSLIISKYKIVNGNIKIDAIIDILTQNISLYCKQIIHHYPSNENYLNGIDVVSYKYIRENPHNKIWNQTLREITDNIIATKNVYEVLYQNAEDCLTEGSRSNLFFVKGHELYSASDSEILLGITRKYIISAAENTGFKLVEKKIYLNEISNFESAFLSGTSPKVLPIRKVNSVVFDVENKNLRKIMSDFDQIIEKDIRNFKF